MFLSIPKFYLILFYYLVIFYSVYFIIVFMGILSLCGHTAELNFVQGILCYSRYLCCSSIINKFAHAKFTTCMNTVKTYNIFCYIKSRISIHTVTWTSGQFPPPDAPPEGTVEPPLCSTYFQSLKWSKYVSITAWENIIKIRY